jgi:hypothetical protein
MDTVIFKYSGNEDCVRIRIIVEDNVIVDDYMSGSPGSWEYSHKHYPTHGIATVEFLDCSGNQLVRTTIYIDPSGVVFDTCTGEPVRNATATLYYWSEFGWKKAEPKTHFDDVVPNPQTTDFGGGYGWDVTPRIIYKVKVIKSGYNDAESVNITTLPITNLNIPLMPVGGCLQPYVISSDSTGAEKNVFVLNEDIYCHAGNLPPDQVMDIYIVPNKAWSVGDSIGTDISDGLNTVSTDSFGSIPTTKIWPAPLTAGEYDIVVDVDRDGILDVNEPVDDFTLNDGVEIIPEFPLIAIPVISLLAILAILNRR